jgi:hypothetical protein
MFELDHVIVFGMLWIVRTVGNVAEIVPRAARTPSLLHMINTFIKVF